MTSPLHMSTLRQSYQILQSVKNLLEVQFPNRPFTIDGVMLGSIGEVITEYHYDITLGSSSAPGHDGIHNPTGYNVQVKFTQNPSARIRMASQPDHLLVIHSTFAA